MEIFLTVTMALAILTYASIIVYSKLRDFIDPLWWAWPLSEEEELLLETLDEEYHADYITYIRTMEMTPELSVYMNENKDCLEATSYYMLLKFAKADETKKKKWETEPANEAAPRKVSYVEKRINQCLVVNPLSSGPDDKS